MTIEQDLLAILTARKVFDGTVWRAYDSFGDEIPDTYGALAAGAHGAMLNANARSVKKPDQITWGYGPMVHPPIKELKKSKKRRQNEAILMMLM